MINVPLLVLCGISILTGISLFDACRGKQNCILEDIKYDENFPIVYESCSICIEDFVDDHENLIKIKSCGHVYHKKCILKWLNVGDTCPNCQIKIT